MRLTVLTPIRVFPSAAPIPSIRKPDDQRTRQPGSEVPPRIDAAPPRRIDVFRDAPVPKPFPAPPDYAADFLT
jgi:hypothetical protein